MNNAKGKTAVIDYGAGNLHSVMCALRRAGANAFVAESPSELCDCGGIILPGVGAFGYAMRSLRESGFDTAIKGAAKRGVPLLGICLGMQILFSESEESPGEEGLNILPGKVTLLKAEGLKTPHMGWTDIFDCGGRLLQGVNSGEFMYFVHSFGVHSEGCRAAAAEYGEIFDAAAERGNVFATQFHPEKSGESGAKILRNFMRICEEENA